MAGHPDAYLQVRLSPDEKRVAYDRGIGSIFQNDRHLWLLDLTSGIASPFTFGSDGEGQPVWSPDGRQVAFVKVKEGKGTIYLKNVGANEEELLSGSDGFQNLEDWSRDGQTLIVRTTAPNPDAVFALPLTGERKATKLFESPFRKQKVQLSPDGRWVSFNSNDSGKMEVYVASFPAFTDRRQVSNAGGAQARWRKDGRELFYLGLDGKLMSVDIKKPLCSIGPPGFPRGSNKRVRRQFITRADLEVRAGVHPPNRQRGQQPSSTRLDLLGLRHKSFVPGTASSRGVPGILKAQTWRSRLSVDSDAVLKNSDLMARISSLVVNDAVAKPASSSASSNRWALPGVASINWSGFNQYVDVEGCSRYAVQHCSDSPDYKIPNVVFLK